jgi:DNA-binding beta-propeller fold protein YncE
VAHRRAGLLIAALAACAGAAGCGGGGSAGPSFISPNAPGREAARATPVRHYEYVFPDQSMLVYDIDHGHRLVQRRAFPQAQAIRGVAASPRTHRLYVSFGSDRGDHAQGSLLAYDLIANRVLWQRDYAFGIDSMAITPNGRTIYMPVGEASMDTTWRVINAMTGAVRSRISAGRGPHNTVTSLDGRRVYLGGRYDRFLYVASTSTNRVIERIGPLILGVRPFTIDGRQRFAFTTATRFRGFQVSSIRTGRVLYTVSFGSNAGLAPGDPPSHGISLSPDERQLWVFDAPPGLVHVFDVTGLPRHRPRQVGAIKLRVGLSGGEVPCSYACGRNGWLLHSLDGR